MDYKDYKALKVERDGHVLRVTLNRPDSLNAFNEDMEHDFMRLLVEVPRDKETRVVVLTGEGRAFSAGGDFDQMQEVIDDPVAFTDNIWGAKFLVSAMLECPKPFICKINGPAMGLGATLALLCDFTIADDNAKIADPHVKVGFVAGDGGSLLWPQLIGYARAKEYLLLGDTLTGKKAAEIGLITRSAPTEELDSVVEDYVKRVLSVPPRALQWTKLSVNIGLKQISSSLMDASIAYEGLSNITADHQEALSAIREKRAPKFTGR